MCTNLPSLSLSVGQVVSLLVPLRYDLHRLGGSWAQRQVFNLTMIQAAVNDRDIPMAMALVAELKVKSYYTHHNS